MSFRMAVDDVVVEEIDDNGVLRRLRGEVVHGDENAKLSTAFCK